MGLLPFEPKRILQNIGENPARVPAVVTSPASALVGRSHGKVGLEELFALVTRGRVVPVPGTSANSMGPRVEYHPSRPAIEPGAGPLPKRAHLIGWEKDIEMVILNAYARPARGDEPFASTDGSLLESRMPDVDKGQEPIGGHFGALAPDRVAGQGMESGRRDEKGNRRFLVLTIRVIRVLFFVVGCGYAALGSLYY